MLETIIDYIARTNLFNFAIFAIFIIIIAKKIKAGEKLDMASTAVAEHIEDSEKAKEESISKLEEAEQKVINLEEEVNEIISQSIDNAKLVGSKIIEDTDKSVLNIKDNTSKLIQNQAMMLKDNIIKKASIASIEVAKKHIINELNANPELHDKYIDESIEAINGVGI